jgi:hypothetical protein
MAYFKYLGMTTADQIDNPDEWDMLVPFSSESYMSSHVLSRKLNIKL